MQNLSLLFAFVCGKNVESLFEDQHFADDFMYVDSIATLKAGEREARRLMDQEHGENDDEDDAPSSATPYKSDPMGTLIVGLPMLLLPVLLWALPKWVLSDENKTKIEEMAWIRPATYALSIVIGCGMVLLAPETSEEDPSDEHDDDNVPQASKSGYTAKLLAFLPMFAFASLAFLMSVVLFYFKPDKMKDYQQLAELIVMAVGFVGQLVLSMM